jgi:hypothetical protein
MSSNLFYKAADARCLYYVLRNNGVSDGCARDLNTLIQATFRRPITQTVCDLFDQLCVPNKSSTSTTVTVDRKLQYVLVTRTYEKLRYVLVTRGVPILYAMSLAEFIMCIFATPDVYHPYAELADVLQPKRKWLFWTTDSDKWQFATEQTEVIEAAFTTGCKTISFEQSLYGASTIAVVTFEEPTIVDGVNVIGKMVCGDNVAQNVGYAL